MDYRRVYMQVINRAKALNRKKGQGVYFENHHILPRSMFPRWTKRRENQVLLTAREHYFCHQLLSKIYPNDKMFLGLWRLANDSQNKQVVKGSKDYSKLREHYSKLCSMKYRGEGNPMFGKRGKDHPGYGYRFTDDEKAERSKRFTGPGNPMFGKPVSKERRASCKEATGYRILCVNTGEVFDTEKEAALKTGVCRTSILRLLNGEISRGYTVNMKTKEKFYWKILRKGRNNEHDHKQGYGKGPQSREPHSAPY